MSEGAKEIIVLNLIINGLPSIPMRNKMTKTDRMGFKPYYKWITFNTANKILPIKTKLFVLNLIINGLPSIPLTKGMNVVFMLERSLFYMVAKFEHFSVIHGLLTFYIKFLLQFFYFF